MDISEFRVSHAVAVQEVRIRHFVDLSPVLAVIARHVRDGVIAIVIGLSTVSIAKAYLASRRPARAN
jgi:hypothetical protein